MKFADIPQFPQAYYSIHVDLCSLKSTLDHWNERESPLILDPEWQRGRVWTEDQQISFMEYFLKGGTTGRDIYFNCSSWMAGFDTPVYCLDGLQRLTAAEEFLDDKIKVFGHYFSEYEDRPRIVSNARFVFNMLCLKNKKELLKVYIDFNSGGTPHKPKEIERIQKMMEDTPEDVTI